MRCILHTVVLADGTQSSAQARDATKVADLLGYLRQFAADGGKAS